MRKLTLLAVAIALLLSVGLPQKAAAWVICPSPPPCSQGAADETLPSSGADVGAAIQTAYNAGYRSVTVLSGAAILSTTVAIPTHSELLMEAGTGITLATGANATMFIVSNTDGVLIRGGQLDGNRTGNTSGGGIYGMGTRGLRVENTSFREFAGTGIELVNGIESEANSITGVNMSQMGLYGVRWEGIKDSLIQGFHYESEVGSHAIYWRMVISSSISQAHISALGDGVRLEWRNRHNTLSQIDADNGNGYGVSFIDNVPTSGHESANTLSNSAFYNQLRSGVLILRSQYQVVTGVTSTKNGRNGYYVSHGVEIVDSQYNQVNVNMAVDTNANPTQSYGIWEGGTSDWNDFRLNRVMPNKNGGINIVGPNSVW